MNMLDKSYAAHFRELQWLANYYDNMGQKEKAREIRDSLVSYFVKDNQQPASGDDTAASDDVADDDGKQTGTYG